MRKSKIKVGSLLAVLFISLLATACSDSAPKPMGHPEIPVAQGPGTPSDPIPKP